MDANNACSQGTNQKLLRCLVFEQEATAMGGDSVKGQPKTVEEGLQGQQQNSTSAATPSERC